MKISIYGTGYVGLVAGVCFANRGHKVICYDVDREKIKKLQEMKSVLFEPDFDNLLKNALENKNIEFSCDLEHSIQFSSIHLMCVGTPSEDNGEADLSYLYHAVENLASNVKEDFIVVIKSTVPVGTGNKVKRKIEETLIKCNKKLSFHVVSCPEFLAQGSAIHNFLYPDRIVIGTDCQSAFEKVKELYASIISSEHRYKVPVLFMNSSSAELTKYAANLFLAMKISYVNEISRIAELVDADIVDVIHAMITDKRIGKGMSHPGCGFGGSCFSKDLKALIYQSQELGYTPALIKSAFEVNESHKKYFIEKVFELCGDAVNGKTIAVWGLAFKANTDDLRDSISCQMIEALLKQGAIVHAFDPAANLHAKEKFHSYPNFKVFSSKNQAVEGANLLVVMTEWPEFLDLDVEFMIRSMKNPILVDGRNIYDPQFLTKQGLSYFAIGKGFIHAIG